MAAEFAAGPYDCSEACCDTGCICTANLQAILKSSLERLTWSCVSEILRVRRVRSRPTRALRGEHESVSVALADPHTAIALLFMEGIQRQTLGCGSGTGVTTYTPEGAHRLLGDCLLRIQCGANRGSVSERRRGRIDGPENLPPSGRKRQ